MLTAKELRELIAEAASSGRYCLGILRDGVKVRIVGVRTKESGEIQVETAPRTWESVDYYGSFKVA